MMTRTKFITMIILSMILFLILGLNVKGLDKTPIAYWSFDNENGGITPDYYNNYNATVTNSPVHSNADCISGYCYTFDGTNEYITTPLIPNVTKGNYTFSVWVKATDLTSGALAVWGTTNDIGSGGAFGLYSRISTASNLTLYPSPTETRTINNWLNDWVYISNTYDNNTKIHRLYINGILNKTSTVNAPTVYENLTFGRFGLYDGHYYIGLIDEFTVYNDLLNSSEILELYDNNGSPIFPPPPLIISNITSDNNNFYNITGLCNDTEDYYDSINYQWFKNDKLFSISKNITENFEDETDFNDNWYSGSCKEVGLDIFETRPKQLWSLGRVGTGDSTERWSHKNLTTSIQIDSCDSDDIIWNITYQWVSSKPEWTGVEIVDYNIHEGFIVRYGIGGIGGYNLYWINKANDIISIMSGTEVLSSGVNITFGQWCNGSVFFKNYDTDTMIDSAVWVNNITQIDCVSTSTRWSGWIDYFDLNIISKFNITIYNSSDYNYTDEFIFSCQGVKGSITSEWFNSTNYKIDQLPPLIYDISPETQTDFFPEVNDSYLIYFNATDLMTNIDNCSLFHNISGTYKYNVTADYVSDNDYLLNFTIPEIKTLVENNISYFIRCYDEKNNYNDSGIYNITVRDVTIPEVITTWTTNKSILFPNTAIDYNFTFKDQNLFSVRFDWWNGTRFVEHLDIVGTEQNVNFTINASHFEPGAYWFNYTVTDGHTARRIDDYEIVKNPITNTLDFKFSKKDYVKINRKGVADTFSSFNAWKDESKGDRYLFEYSKSTTEKVLLGKDAETLVFTVTSSHPITIVTDTDYNAHLVVLDLYKWIDFETDTSVGDYKLTQISDTEVEVTIYNVKDDKIIFKSIGDLNVVSDTYYFTVANITVNYVENVVENQEQTIQLEIDLFNRSFIANTSAILIYNNTLKSLDKYIIGNVDYYNATFNTKNITNNSNTIEIVDFYWDINITDLNATPNIYNYNTNLTNQTIFNLQIISCTGSNENFTKFITFTGKTEEYDNGIINYSLNIWNEISFLSGGVELNFEQGFNFTNNYTYSLCLPLNITGAGQYTFNAIMEYNSPDTLNPHGLNFVDRKYHIVDLPLNKTGQEIYLYLLDEDRSTDVVLNILDRISGEGIPDAYIKILRFYPETGNYLTVEIEKTDNIGQTLGKMVLADMFYKFIIEKDGEILLSTTVEKILTVNKKFYVTQTTDSLESFRLIKDVWINLRRDYDNKRFILDWSDVNNIVRTITLEVKRENTLGSYLLSKQTESSPAGTIVYEIIEDTDGNNYQADVYIVSDTEYSLEHIETSNMNFTVKLGRLLGVSSLFPLFLLLMCVALAFVDYGGSTAVIGGSLVILLIGFFIGLLPISWISMTTFVIIGIIFMAKISKI